MNLKNMEVKARLSNLRVAPRKARLVADLVRGKTLPQAQSILSFTTNRSSKDILKLINSAAASAKHNFHLDEQNLFVSKITVDEGIKMKRWHPMSRGRAYQIIKRTSHVAVVLSEIKPSEKKEEKTEEKAAKTQKPKARKISKPRTKNKKTKVKK